MDSDIKKGAWKIFSVASFLFITIFFILPYLVQISTYFHEKAHSQMLTKYNIDNSYQINLLDTIPDFFNPKVDKLGVTNFDLNNYLKLNKYQKLDINIAGVVSDLRFLFLIGIYLSFVNVYLFYRIKFGKEYNLIWILAINWILFMWLLALIQITMANITFTSGDFYRLIYFLG
jgi:hypothetical protein